MNSKVKVIIAVICLAAAGVVLAMNFGWIGGGKPKPVGTQGAQSTTGGATGTEGTKTDEDAQQNAGQLKKERN